jgi:hypothetical protein
MPATGEELEQRLATYDDRLAQEGVIMSGDLLMTVSAAVAKAGHGLDTRKWGEQAIKLAIAETKAFEAKARTNATRKQQTLNHITGKEI